MLDNKILELKPDDNLGNTDNIEILKLKSMVKPSFTNNNNTQNITTIIKPFSKNLKKIEDNKKNNLNQSIQSNKSNNFTDQEVKRLNKLYDSLKL